MVCHSSSCNLDISTSDKMDVFDFYDKYGKELICPNIVYHRYNDIICYQDVAIIMNLLL